jgi:hypothetical protein
MTPPAHRHHLRLTAMCDSDLAVTENERLNSYSFHMTFASTSICLDKLTESNEKANID